MFVLFSTFDGKFLEETKVHRYSFHVRRFTFNSADSPPSVQLARGPREVASAGRHDKGEGQYGRCWEGGPPEPTEWRCVHRRGEPPRRNNVVSWSVGWARCCVGSTLNGQRSASAQTTLRSVAQLLLATQLCPGCRSGRLQQSAHGRGPLPRHAAGPGRQATRPGALFVGGRFHVRGRMARWEKAGEGVLSVRSPCGPRSPAPRPSAPPHPERAPPPSLPSPKLLRVTAPASLLPNPGRYASGDTYEGEYSNGKKHGCRGPASGVSV